MIEVELGQLTSQDTGFPCDVMEVQPDTTKPYYLIEHLASPPWMSTLGKTAVEGEVHYLLSVVGVSPDHVRQAEGRLIQSLRDTWKDIPTAMGPPDLRRNGGGRQDDLTYRLMIVATYRVEIP